MRETQDNLLKGWLLQQLAEYTHPINPAEAQVMQRSAVGLNTQLLKPIAGVQYVKLGSQPFDQATQCASRLKEEFPNPNDFILRLNALLEALVFQPETSEPFERSLAELAPLIGFEGQRPEKEVGVGPDVLWRLGGLTFLVIECKNGATTRTINKHDCNQLGGSINWFHRQYDASCTVVPVMIHPSNTFERAGTPHEDMRVMTSGKLPVFVDAIRRFAIGSVADGQYRTTQEIARLLDTLSLTAEKLVGEYTVRYRSER